MGNHSDSAGQIVSLQQESADLHTVGEKFASELLAWSGN